MKTQDQYEQHNSDSLEEGWEAVEEYLQDALSISWDTCHKIYLAMDETEAAWFAKNYDEATVKGSPEEMLETIKEWWDESCELRFVNAVWHNEDDPNAGFVSLISQFATDEEPCGECGETWCDGSCGDDDEDEDGDEDEDEEI